MTPTPESHTHPPVAKTVVWRHPCHCKSASRPLEPGEEPEHRFDVDGQPFPWYITEGGASFVKHGEHYLVKVEILPIECDGNNEPLDITLSYWRRQVRIGERLFPWAILSGSLVATMGEGDFPMLKLTFIAEHVDADVEIPGLDIWTARDPLEAELERNTRRPPPAGPPHYPADVAPIDETRAASLEAEHEDRRISSEPTFLGEVTRKAADPDMHYTRGDHRA